MTQVHYDAATVEFRSADGKVDVVVFAHQVFAITTMATTGKTIVLGPANAVAFVDCSVKEARDRLVAALMHAPKIGDE